MDPETAAVRFRYLGEEPGAWQDEWDMSREDSDPARGRDHPRRPRGQRAVRAAGSHRADPGGHAMRRERGFVLLAVLLVLTLLAVVVTELAFSARLEASMVRSYRDGVLGRHLAEAAVQQAIREIATPAQVAALDEAGQLVFYRALPGQTTPTRLPALPRARVALGPGEFSYRLADESARLAINTAARAGSIGCWRRSAWTGPSGTSSPTRFRTGATRTSCTASTGPRAPSTWRCPCPIERATRNLQDAAELLQIRGVTPDLYRGDGERPGLGELVTAAAVSAVNLNTASPLVLTALGLSDAEIADVVQTRVRAPYPSVPGRFAGRGLAVGSSVFRIEAEGWVAGAVRSRVVAVVQRGRQERAARGDDPLLASGSRAVMSPPDRRLPARRAPHRGRAHRPRSLIHVVVEEAEDPAATLAAELRARGLGRGRLRLGLDRRLAVVKAIELPRAAGNDLARMIGFDLERHVPFPPEHTRFDWVELPGRADGPHNVLIVAAEARTVERRARPRGRRQAPARRADRGLSRPRRAPAASGPGPPRALGAPSRRRGRSALPRRPPPAHEPPGGRGGSGRARARDPAEPGDRALARPDAVWLSGDDAPAWRVDLAAALGVARGRRRRSAPRALPLVAALPADARGAGLLALGRRRGGPKPGAEPAAGGDPTLGADRAGSS